uniref:Putative tetrapyrrole (Corrin/porphyrin) methylase n=1 Tax=uncultured marine microorganism HF4000_APKG10K24 TaxID=455562 RepID=B3TCI8_9ZZZZ|nr:putative tetrapyrrole (corrin/porphyrin) methylase [uncultured marine microorganism HF4000_APKG10K24]
MSSDSGIPPVTVVAVGPGDSRLLTLRGRQVLEEADVVAGFKTVLDVVAPLLGNAELCPMSYRDQEEVLEYAVGEARKGRSFVVCCWGDLNVSARELLARVRKRADIVELVPGISSIQVACARTGIFMEDSLFITLHKRQEIDDDLTELAYYLKEDRRHIILLPRPYDLMPAGIAAHLVELGISGDRPMLVYQRLTLEGEKRWEGTLKQCAESKEEFSDLTIMIFPHGEIEVSGQRE